jgi:ribonuclease J
MAQPAARPLARPMGRPQPRQMSRPQRRPHPGQNRPNSGVRPAPLSSPSNQARDLTTLKVIPLGGVEGIGRNCTIYEFGDDIIIVDLGIQFPEEDMHGIDFIIPNISYLQGKEKRIKGVIITHGHMDHVGAIPYLMPKLGNPPIYAAPLAAGLIQKRQEEFPRSPKLHIVRISNTAKIPVGKHFTIEPFHVTHNISDAFGLAIHTPVGTIIHTGDFKFDYTPVDDLPADMGRLASIGAKGVLALLSDSTNAQSPGYQISEMQVGESLEHIIKGAKGRIILGMFSSLITRIQQTADIATKEGRRILLIGRSLQQNVEIAHQLGYLKFKKGIMMEEEDFRRLPDEKILVICTGAQGQKNAALMRIARGDDRLIDLKQGDTIVFSSSVIPGNERSVERLMDSLARRGAKVINTTMMDVHAGGHAKQEDLKLMIRLMQPKYFIPIHGTRFNLVKHAELAEECNIAAKNIFISDNGQIIEFTKEGGVLTNKKVPSDHVMVDGLGVGDVSNIVLRERQAMAEEGMIVVIVTMDEKSGEIMGNPDIISRGFIFMKDNQELISKVRNKVRQLAKAANPDSANFELDLKDRIRNDVGQILYSHTRRRPMVLPVIIEV